MFYAYQIKATPSGIMLNDTPLEKVSRSSIPIYSWRYIERAEVLLKEMPLEEWNTNRTFNGCSFPILAKINMLLALSAGKVNTTTLEAPFNLIGQIARGKTLLIGEGNFSFAVSLIQSAQILPANMLPLHLLQGRIGQSSYKEMLPLWKKAK